MSEVEMKITGITMTSSDGRINHFAYFKPLPGFTIEENHRRARELLTEAGIKKKPDVRRHTFARYVEEDRLGAILNVFGDELEPLRVWSIGEDAFSLQETAKVLSESGKVKLPQAGVIFTRLDKAGKLLAAA